LLSLARSTAVRAPAPMRSVRTSRKGRRRTAWPVGQSCCFCWVPAVWSPRPRVAATVARRR